MCSPGPESRIVGGRIQDPPLRRVTLRKSCTVGANLVFARARIPHWGWADTRSAPTTNHSPEIMYRRGEPCVRPGPNPALWEGGYRIRPYDGSPSGNHAPQGRTLCSPGPHIRTGDGRIQDPPLRRITLRISCTAGANLVFARARYPHWGWADTRSAPRTNHPPEIMHRRGEPCVRPGPNPALWKGGYKIRPYAALSSSVYGLWSSTGLPCFLRRRRLSISTATENAMAK